MFTRLKALKVEIEHLQLLMDKAKLKLQKEFEAWWTEEATGLQVLAVVPFTTTPPRACPIPLAWGMSGPLGGGCRRQESGDFTPQAHALSALA